MELCRALYDRAVSPFVNGPEKFEAQAAENRQ
jgi:hypothetical protein